MSVSLPERPDLAQLRRQAKELRDAARREEAGAVERFVRHHGSAPQGAVTLAAPQLVIARELGFASWPRLKPAVEAHATGPERRGRPPGPTHPTRARRRRRPTPAHDRAHAPPTPPPPSP